MKKGAIVFFNDSYPPIIDGVAQAVSNYARTLGEFGWNCTVVAPDAPGLPRGDEIKTVRYFSIPLPRRYPYRVGIWQLVRKCIRALESLDADLVHVHCPFSSGRLGLQFARNRKIPIIGSFHTQYKYDFDNAVRFRWIADMFVRAVARFYDSLDEVWVPNEVTGGILRSYGFRGTSTCVPHGTDFAGINDLARLRAKGDALLGAGPGRAVLLFVGRIVKEKDPSFLLDVMHKLKADGIACTLFFVGEGVGLCSMKKRCVQMGLEDAVVFTGPVYGREELKSCFARADLLLFPSEYDTVGMVVQEAAALGVPSMVVEKSAAATNVDDANGFALPKNADIWASKIALLFSSVPALKSAGENARRTLSQTWNSALQAAQARYAALLQRQTENNTPYGKEPACLEK